MEKTLNVQKKRILCVIFTTVLLFGMTLFCFADAVIDEYWNLAYEVNYDVSVKAPDSGVNLRSGAGTEYEILLKGLIPNGTRLHITYETKAKNGKLWGYTSYDDQSGWVFLGQTTKEKPEQGDTTEKEKQKIEVPKISTSTMKITIVGLIVLAVAITAVIFIQKGKK